MQAFRSTRSAAILWAAVLVVSLLPTWSTPAEAITASSQLAQGYDHACVVTTSGNGYCWGGNDGGQIGDGTVSQRNTPIVVSGGRSWKQLAGGRSFTCGIETSGAAYCWGINDTGQLGIGNTDQQLVPSLVSGGFIWRSLSTGNDHTCGITTSNVAYCWGFNGSGRLGDSSTTQRLTPTLVSGGHSWSAISAGRDGTCGLTHSNTAYCWGEGSSYQLGTNTTADRTAPYQLAGSNWNLVVAGQQNGCGIRATNQLWCWGSSPFGELGTGDNNNYASPVQISGSWASISLGAGFSCAVNTASIAHCSGANGLGALGDGTFTGRQVFTQVAGSYSAKGVTAGGGGGCLLTTGSMVHCWGWNAFGTVGNGNTINQSSPQAVLVISADQASTNFTADIAAAFAFTVSPTVTACNGAAVSAGVSTAASSVNFGNLSPFPTVAAQDLSIETNAANGYTVFLRTTPFTNGSHVFANVSGSNANPSSFPGSGTEAFGYTSSDPSLLTGSPNRFTSAGTRWAAPSLSNFEVSASTASSVTETNCVAFQVQASTQTPAGSYQSLLTYTAVPNF